MRDSTSATRLSLSLHFGGRLGLRRYITGSLEQARQQVTTPDDNPILIVREVCGTIVPTKQIAVTVTQALPRPLNHDLSDDRAVSVS